MNLNEIDWKTITPLEARKMIGAADRHLQAMENRYRATGEPADETLMLAAFTVWEDLRVLHLTGERPA
jgi:hypothetical protein